MNRMIIFKVPSIILLEHHKGDTTRIICHRLNISYSYTLKSLNILKDEGIIRFMGQFPKVVILTEKGEKLQNDLIRINEVLYGR